MPLRARHRRIRQIRNRARLRRGPESRLHRLQPDPALLPHYYYYYPPSSSSSSKPKAQHRHRTHGLHIPVIPPGHIRPLLHRPRALRLPLARPGRARTAPDPETGRGDGVHDVEERGLAAAPARARNRALFFSSFSFFFFIVAIVNDRCPPDHVPLPDALGRPRQTRLRAARGRLLPRRGNGDGSDRVVGVCGRVRVLGDGDAVVDGWDARGRCTEGCGVGGRGRAGGEGGVEGGVQGGFGKEDPQRGWG